MAKKVEVVALPIQQTVDELVRLQRERAAVLKTTIMNENRLKAVIAGTLGYESRMSEDDRAKKFDEAGELIKSIADGEISHPMKAFIIASNGTVTSLRQLCKELERQMEHYAIMLPVSAWIKQKEQTGFGLIGLAKIVGECGNLSNYSNPGKVWRRMGCAPWKYQGTDTKYNPHKMGSTWRFGKEGKLPSSEWEEFGYSPRRRSIAYQISEVLIKLNKSIYRERYIQAKRVVYKSHPEWDWKTCIACKGTTKLIPDGETIPIECPTCGGTGKKCMRAHRHGMLLSVKKLLLNLWGEWNGWPPYEMPWMNKR